VPTKDGTHKSPAYSMCTSHAGLCMFCLSYGPVLARALLSLPWPKSQEGDDGDRVLRAEMKPRIESSPVSPHKMIGAVEFTNAGSGKRWSFG
jgi:hypothetical protein